MVSFTMNAVGIDSDSDPDNVRPAKRRCMRRVEDDAEFSDDARAPDDGTVDSLRADFMSMPHSETTAKLFTGIKVPNPCDRSRPILDGHRRHVRTPKMKR